MVDLGKIGIRNRGDHVAGNQYEKNDIVKNDGIVYFCLKDTSDAPTTENTEYWQVWSREAAEMHGATSSEDGAGGLVPKPLKGDEKKALLGDGMWGDVSIDVDDVLSDTSENPVQNKVINAKFNNVTSSISDTKNSKVTFTSKDTLAPTELSEMPSVIKSGETHASMLSKISTVFKNMRYIIGLLGSTDISKETLGIGDSTVTGAIKGLNESLDKKVTANMHGDMNLYIKKGIDDNGEHCDMTNSGFKFGIPYKSDIPGCGIGNMRSGGTIYLSVGMTNYYDPLTDTSYWINTLAHPTVELNFSPCAVLLSCMEKHICGKNYEPGVYILSATRAVRELKAIIPDSEITVTKIG